MRLLTRGTRSQEPLQKNIVMPFSFGLLLSQWLFAGKWAGVNSLSALVRSGSDKLGRGDRTAGQSAVVNALPRRWLSVGSAW